MSIKQHDWAGQGSGCPMLLYLPLKVSGLECILMNLGEQLTIAKESLAVYTVI